MQDERLREDAKQLLRVARERRVVDGVGGIEVDLSAAEQRGLESDSPHLEALVDFMKVAGWRRAPPATRRATLSEGLPRAAWRC